MAQHETRVSIAYLLSLPDDRLVRAMTSIGEDGFKASPAATLRKQLAAQQAAGQVYIEEGR